MGKGFFIVLGLVVGLVAGLAVDMLLNDGMVAARHLHHSFPECSNTCHG